MSFLSKLGKRIVALAKSVVIWIAVRVTVSLPCADKPVRLKITMSTTAKVGQLVNFSIDSIETNLGNTLPIPAGTTFEYNLQGTSPDNGSDGNIQLTGEDSPRTTYPVTVTDVKSGKIVGGSAGATVQLLVHATFPDGTSLDGTSDVVTWVADPTGPHDDEHPVSLNITLTVTDAATNPPAAA